MEETGIESIEIQKIEKGQILWNYDRMKDVLYSYADRYRDIVVTEESLKGCQAVQRELAGMRRALDEKRKEVKRELEKPVADFDHKAKDLIGIIETVEKPIKAGIDVFEFRRREEREQFINQTFENSFPEGMPEKFKKIEVLPSWLNKTTSDNELVGIIVGIVQTKTDEWKREESDLLLIRTLCETASEGLKNKLDPKQFTDRYFFGVLPAVLAGEISKEATKRKESETELVKEATEAAKVQPVEKPVIQAESKHPAELFRFSVSGRATIGAIEAVKKILYDGNFPVKVSINNDEI